MHSQRKATLLEALIPIVFLIIILALSLTIFNVDPQIPLLLATGVASLIGVYRLKFKWADLEDGIISTIKMALQSILILLIVGTLIGTWILSGVVPSMIYWGLNLLSPSIFLVATFLVCSIVAVATGSSWTTAGTVGIALLGIGQTLDMAQIDIIKETLVSNFNTLSPILLIAPASVIIMVILKIPALPALLAGSLMGGLFAIIFQGASLGDVMTAMHYGYESHTGVVTVDELLTRGGLDSMLWTVSLVFCALSFGGVLEKTGMLEVIASTILKFAKGTFGLVFATIATCLFTNISTGDQYLGIVMPGRMYKEEYEKRNLAAKNLSRAIEDSATVTSPLIPWTTCGSYMIATLGINPIAFLPYAFFNLLSPIFSLILAATGWSMEKREPNQK